ncbi:MAG: competence protein ComEA [Oleiphilaceae bacterium]
MPQHLIHLRQGKHIMKASRLSAIVSTKILIQITFICCLLFNTLIAHANEEITSSTSDNVIASESEKININTADAKHIASSLKGIGLKKAAAIIEYRKTYGPFQNIEELTSVSGIGDATVQKNAHLIAIK